MPNLSADELVMQLQHKRTFLQFGGAMPMNSVKFYGVDTQYLIIDSAQVDEQAALTPIWVPDPFNPKRYRMAARSLKPASIPSAKIVIREKHGSIPRQLLRIDCPLSVYEPTGPCGQLSDFIGGWKDYVLIYENGLVSKKALGNRTAWEKDDPVEDSLDVEFSAIYPIGPLIFGQDAVAQIDKEVTDVVYGPSAMCQGCDWGDSRLYLCTKSSGAGSPGMPAEVIWSLDGGVSFQQKNVESMTAAEDGIGIEIAGNYLIVIGTDAYHIAEINPATGNPGVFTKISAGFVAGKSPKDVYVVSQRDVFFCGLGGYVYHSSDLTMGVTVYSAGTATAQDLTRIKGQGDTIVAVGKLGAVIRSLNHGLQWSATTTSPVSAYGIQAVEVMDTNRYWVGTDTYQRVFYTIDGGESWLEQTFVGSSGFGQIYDILFATQSVGYISLSNSTPTANLMCTWDGGADWGISKKARVNNWPTFSRGNRLAVPRTDEPSWSSNAIAIAGLNGGGTGGIFFVGYAARS